ncbi:MAG: hypothetical protein HY668_00105 [Chloroflexi bacterium]|nr:hypothetical protein [Chloroflexota bacterium]
MTEKVLTSELTLAGDARAIAHFRMAIGSGKHWYIALLEAIGLWASAEETVNGHTYRYLIGGEAFDWLLLAERLCQTVEGLLPEGERDALLFHGQPPLHLGQTEVKALIGTGKYRQYLNYFYGVTVETALLLTTQDEVYKERWTLGFGREGEVSDEAYRRIYDATRAELLKQFRREKGYAPAHSTTLTEMQEFTYWLFKYRLTRSEKAKVASDTRKALDYLRRQWARKGCRGVLVTGETPADCR